MKTLFVLLVILTTLAINFARADDFFDIASVTLHRTPPTDGPSVFNEVHWTNKNKQKVISQFFQPFLEIRVSVKGQIQSSSLIGKAYFYDAAKKLITTAIKPNVVDRGNNQKFDWPFILPKGDQFIYFGVPNQVLKTQGWSAVIVFGDSKGTDAKLYGDVDELELTNYSYPEKGILENKDGPPIERKPAMDPVVAHVVQTENPDQPQITLFMRPPLGMTNASQAKGVLAMCVLAGNVDGVKRQLQGFAPGHDVQGILKFAEDHKLIIICWGSHGLWDPRRNWDALSPDTAWDTDKAFDQVANAWAKGVQYFVATYGIPPNGYLLWGESGAAQYACRLALRKPDYFVAVHVHIPSSFDKPTPAASKVLWCLTTGELEAGHARSLQFYSQCRALGYPMIYKAIVGLGHEASPIADDLGARFFEYALSVRAQRVAFDGSLNDPFAQLQMAQTNSAQAQPWLVSFRQPAFVGDVVNQEMFPLRQAGVVPASFRTSLPTKAIADAWNR